MTEHHKPDCSCFACNDKRKRIEQRGEQLQTLWRDISELTEDQIERLLQMVADFKDRLQILDLLRTIDDLKKQLAALKEAGEFLDRYIRLANKYDVPDDDFWLINSYGDGGYSKVKVGQIRRLAKALKEIE